MASPTRFIIELARTVLATPDSTPKARAIAMKRLRADGTREDVQRAEREAGDWFAELTT